MRRASYEAAAVPSGATAVLGAPSRRAVAGRPNLAYVRKTRVLIARSLRATRLVVADRRIPRPLRWIAALALLPLPGPLDEAVLLVLAPILFVFHRTPMREAWRDAESPELRC